MIEVLGSLPSDFIASSSLSETLVRNMAASAKVGPRYARPIAHWTPCLYVLRSGARLMATSRLQRLELRTGKLQTMARGRGFEVARKSDVLFFGLCEVFGRFLRLSVSGSRG